MGMTLKELLTKGEGTISAKEAKALAAQCRMDEETLYTLLEERGIKVLEEDTEPMLDVDSIMAEVESAENNNDDLGITEDEDEQSEENPADLKAAMDELLDDQADRSDPAAERRAGSGAEPPHPCRCRGGAYPAGRPSEVRRAGVHQEEQRPLLL